jgi:predicted nucleotidyltransferase
VVLWYSYLKATAMLEREAILNSLRIHKTDLAKMGVISIALFGSAARGEGPPDSDVDLLVELAPPLSYDTYTRVNFYLKDLLGCPVDLVFLDKFKSRIRPSVLAEAIYVT